MRKDKEARRSFVLRHLSFVIGDWVTARVVAEVVRISRQKAAYRPGVREAARIAGVVRGGVVRRVALVSRGAELYWTACDAVGETGVEEGTKARRGVAGRQGVFGKAESLVLPPHPALSRKGEGEMHIGLRPITAGGGCATMQIR